MSGDALTPEAQARVLIDERLRAAGWHVCDRGHIDLVNHVGVAVREVPMADGHGIVDYLLFVDRKPVGVLEAKKDGVGLAGVEWQSARYATGLPDAFRDNAVTVEGRLPFVFEATGVQTRFTNGFDPDPRARSLFSFPQPATLARIVREGTDGAWRHLVRDMPPFNHYPMRPAQFDAVGGVERALAVAKYSRSLVQMATGAGKTYFAVTEAYRLLKYGNFNRILFLVDRNNLGDQTLREFQNYSTPDDGRKFTELYNVAKLTSAGMAGSTKVAISTIQRVFSVLRGHEVPDEDDDGIDDFTPDAPVTVEYNPELPPEAFDLIIVDECHRSIYGVWRSVIEYFDAHLVGLTATPTKQTFGFFEQNLVSEYTYPQSVADGVNVDFEVYRIKTEISEEGSTIDAGTVVPVQDRRTREERLEELDEDVEYSAGQLDRDVTSKAQIRLILETFRDRLFTEIFPGRSVVPKTLIFAKDDNHAEEIVNTIRQVFGKGNDFAAKITSKAHDAKNLLQQFRNSPTLRVAVTVDMIATGTDVRPIECVFFMRDVRSRTYFEQMKGRGSRTINDADFQAVTADAAHKDRFIIVDAVGVTEHEFTDAAPLERSTGVSLKQLFERAANLTITADETASLAARLSRLHRQLSPDEAVEITELAGGQPLTHIVQELIKVSDPDELAAVEAYAPTGSNGEPDMRRAMRDFVDRLVTPIAGNPQLRERLLEIRATHDRIIDEVSTDRLIMAGGVIDYDKCQHLVTSWKAFIEEHRDDIGLLQVLYSQPQGAKITFAQLKELADRIKAPPRSWTIDAIWNAYEALNGDHVKKTDRHTATDLIALIRFTLEHEPDLVPYATTIDDRYQNWLAQQAQNGVEFTDQQRWWLDRIRDTIIQNAGITDKDLDLAPFTEHGGTDGYINALGPNAATILNDLTETLAA